MPGMATPRDMESKQPSSSVICVVLLSAVGLAAFASHHGIGRPGREQSLALAFPDVTLVSLTDKPKADPRDYVMATFENGLKAVAIQDKASTTSAYSVSVRAGSFDDPLQLPGLAHFCEHMLFLGTEKYPEPSGFDDFMSANGGSNNAYTASELTNYYASCSSKAGSEALKRLADFFRAPLFAKEYVKKEINAIQSEHDKNVQDPSHRTLQVLYSLSDGGSPLGRFHTGTKDTLVEWPKGNGTDPLEALRTYFDTHYCAAKMQVVSFGPESLKDQLAALKREFGGMPRGGDECVAERSWAEPKPWPKETLGKYVVIQGTSPSTELWMHFPLADTTQDYKSQALYYLEHALSYSGSGSFPRLLQDELGLVTGISLSGDVASTGTQAFIVAELTPKGEKDPELVMDLVFSYLSSIRRAGVDMELYKSLSSISALMWDWGEPADPESLVSDLSERLTRLDAASLLNGDERIDAPDADRVMELLAGLNPDNMNVGLVSKGALEDVANSSRQTLPFYDVSYAVSDADEKLPDARKRWTGWLDGSVEEANITSYIKKRLERDELLPKGEEFRMPQLPPAIEGVPTALSLAHMHAEGSETSLWGKKPDLMGGVAASDNGRTSVQFLENLQHGNDDTWFREGWVATSPKVNAQLTLRQLRAPDDADASALDGARLSIYSSLLAEELNPKMVDLVSTGVGYGISPGLGSLSISFSGFTPLLDQVIDKVLSEFNAFNNGTAGRNAERFERLIEKYKRDLKVFNEMPVSYALGDRSVLLERGAHSRSEVLAALENLTLDSVMSSVNELVLSKPLKLTSLTMGNMDEATAKQISGKVVNGIRLPEGVDVALAGDDAEVQYLTPIVSLPGPTEVRLANPRHNDENHVAVVTLVGRETTIEGRVVNSILGKIIQSTAYTHLRTELQLGYVVQGGASLMSNVEYLSIMVQGTVLDADATEAAIEKVLSTLLPQALRNLTDADFEAHREAYVQELLEPPLGPSEEFDAFWIPISNGARCFDLRASLQDFATKHLTREKLVQGFEKFADSGEEGTRKKLVVKYFPEKAPERLSLEDAQKLWEKQGLSESHRALLEREYGETHVLETADSDARNSLAKKNGYFSTALNCQTHTASALEESRNLTSREDSAEPKFLLKRSRARMQHNVQLRAKDA